MCAMAINESDVDIVIGASRSDLTSFMGEWKPIFSRFHLIIVKDLNLSGELKIPEGFDVNVYGKSDIERVAGSSAAALFSGKACRYFGFLVSQKKYIISFDENSIPAKDSNGALIDPVAQHIRNLATPATPFFFNTLYDPYRKGTDFVRGYPFSMRSGVSCGLSCGLWSITEDGSPPKTYRYVDAVLTIPLQAKMALSGHNIAFDRKAMGPALIPSLGELWGGMCAKFVADRLGLGVKSGLPYVWLKSSGAEKEDLEVVKLMEEVIPFLEGLKIPESAVTAEDCVAEIGKAADAQLGRRHPAFAAAAKAMLCWADLWKKSR